MITWKQEDPGCHLGVGPVTLDGRPANLRVILRKAAGYRHWVIDGTVTVEGVEGRVAFGHWTTVRVRGVREMAPMPGAKAYSKAGGKAEVDRLIAGGLVTAKGRWATVAVPAGGVV